MESIEKAKIQYQEWLDKECLKEAEKGLMRLIRGEEYTETTTEFGLDKNGNPIQTKQKQVVKRILPNPTAIIFALCNRDPERWKNRVNNEVSGKITTETKNSVSLASVPDDLLEQVIDAINNGK